MIERTEELGLAAHLPIVVGGREVRLRTLNLEESESWQTTLASLAANIDVPVEKGDVGALLTAFAKQPTSLMLAAVQAYDIDGVLGQDLRKRLTQRELYAAVKQMVLAESPLVTDLRSAVEAFGPQLRLMAASVLATLFQQASSTSSPLLNGGSTPALSVVGSRKKGSSSSGPTASSA